MGTTRCKNKKCREIIQLKRDAINTQAADCLHGNRSAWNSAQPSRTPHKMKAPLLGILTGLLWAASIAEGVSAETRPSLRQAAERLFPIGAGVSDRVPERPEDWPLLTEQFSIITPENCLKPAAVQAAEGRFRFTQPDAFVDFATRQRLQVVGHCLVWAKDDRTPPWFFRDGTNSASGSLLLERIDDVQAAAREERQAGRYHHSLFHA